jgi:hypothetical protein
MASRKLRETAGDYPNIVARLSDKWRVILCGAGIQWILQRRDGERAGRARWAGVGYCRTREALLRLCRASSERVDPAAWAALIALPEHFHNDPIKPAPIPATGPKFVRLMAANPAGMVPVAKPQSDEKEHAMQFPNSGTGRPFVRINGTTGNFALSVADGGEPENIDMTGRVLDLDLTGAEQGHLSVSKDGSDWLPIGARDAWKATPSPSPDHSPGVMLDLMCADWPEPKVRELRASSRAVTGFIARVALAAGDIPAGKAVRIRLTGAKAVRFGKGSSVNIDFELAPRDKWPDVAAFDEHRDAVPEAAPVVPVTKSAGAFDDLEDAAWT